MSAPADTPREPPTVDAEALAELAGKPVKEPAESSVVDGTAIDEPRDVGEFQHFRFGDLNGEEAAEASRPSNELPLRVEYGRTALAASEADRLAAGSLVELGAEADEQVAVVVAGRIIARGQLVTLAGKLGVRILELVCGPGPPGESDQSAETHQSASASTHAQTI